MARQPDLDELPRKESTSFGRQDWWRDGKSNTKDQILLSAIQKKVKASIGKSWNETYSKLKPQVPERLQGCFDWWVNTTGDTNRRWLSLYVDKDGILREPVKTYRKKRRKPRLPPFLTYNKKAYCYWQGFWWVLSFKLFDSIKKQYTTTRMTNGQIVSYVYYEYANDIFFGTTTRKEAIQHWGAKEAFICIDRKQCSGELSKKLDAYSRKKFHIGG